MWKTHKNEGEQLFSTGVSLWLFTNDIVSCILVELLSQVPPQKVQNHPQIIARSDSLRRYAFDRICRSVS
jgi:hypothetical protein